MKYKVLAGGGTLNIVNRTVPEGLRALGYTPEEIQRIIGHIEKFDTIEDVEENGVTVTSGLKPEHLAVFDCAFKPFRGQRSISYLAHLKMMATAQPFISGAISKTVNMPTASTVDDIQDAYVGVEDGLEVRGDLPRWLEALAAVEHQTHGRRHGQGGWGGKLESRGPDQGAGGVFVSGTQLVNHKNKWIRVEDHPNAEEIPYNKPFLYCLNTSNKIIELNNVIFSDWDEIIDDKLTTLQNENIKNLENIHEFLDDGFEKDTQITLYNSKKQISDINIGDILENGSFVYGLVEVEAGKLRKYINNPSPKKLYHLLTMMELLKQIQ